MLDPDVWGTVSDWVVAVTAVAGVGFGAVQLLAIRRAEEDAAAQARIAAEQIPAIPNMQPSFMNWPKPTSFSAPSPTRSNPPLQACRGRANRDPCCASAKLR